MAAVMSNSAASLRLVNNHAAGHSARLLAASQTLQLQPLPLVSPASRLTRVSPHIIAHAARFHTASPSSNLLQLSHIPATHQSRRLTAARAADADAAATIDKEINSDSGSTADGENASTNGAAATSGDKKAAPLSGVVDDAWAVKPGDELPLGGPTGMMGDLGMKLRLLFEAPWKRVKKGSVLSIRLSGAVSEVVGRMGGRGIGSAIG